MREYDQIISSIILIIVGFIVCLGSMRIGFGTFNAPGPGFLPFLAGVFLVLCSLPILIKASFEKKPKVAYPQKPVNLRKSIKAIIGFFAYTLLLSTLGYAIGTFLLMLFLFKGVENLKWRWAVITAVLTVLASYILFDFWLQCMLPKGLFDLRVLKGWIF